METILRAVNISKRYQAGGVTTEALKDVSLNLKEGTILAVMGSSGSGKSTLLHILGGLEAPDSGQVFAEGEKTPITYKEPEVTLYRKRYIGFVFQQFHLMQDLTVKENLSIPLLVEKADPQTIRLRVSKTAQQLGLTGKLLNKPAQLSGGQQQRAAIGRAIITNPKIILADEPTGALDYQTAKDVLDLLCWVCKDSEASMILVTHDPLVAARADQVVFLHNGQLRGEHVNQPGRDNLSEILTMIRSLSVDDEKGVE
ncbi:ABC transporter ATP-binding protein [Anaerovorax odorimutans]|nr:ABC transporter ATP-binding protein [Anaerovorax odorimutans]